MRDLLPCAPAGPGYHDDALFRPITPPGHRAFSRLRFLLTVRILSSLPGEHVLDVAAGPCFAAAALHGEGRKVAVNDLRPLDEALGVWGLGGKVRQFQSDVFALRPDQTGRFDVLLCAELSSTWPTRAGS